MALPSPAISAINNLYDAKLAANNLKDSVLDSNVYGMLLYSGGTIVFFILLIVVIFILIMFLKK